MKEETKIELIDYVVILVKWKKFLVFTLIPIMIITYLIIFFFLEEQYDAKALIVPSGEESMGGLASIVGGLSSNLPFDIGGGTTPEMSLYNTIIYSRSNLEKVIDKFNLIEIFNLSIEDKEYMEKALKILENNVKARETENMAYEIEVRSSSPQLSAEIANYLVNRLNDKLIELRTQKSRNNRIFLEQRIADIRVNLNNSEDSLMKFQESSGILNPEEQFKGVVSAYTELETSLIAKQIEKSILKTIRGEDSPQVKNLEIEVEEFEKRIKEMKVKGEPHGIIPSINTLPQNAVNYFRYLREVEINSTILEFIIPLYEQAKLEEKKDVPTLQIIDYAIPPMKKSFPPRLLLTLLVTFTAFIITFIYILLKENPNLTNTNKMLFIRENLFKWKNS